VKRKTLSAGLAFSVVVAAAILWWIAVGRDRHELGRRRHQVTDVSLACHLYAANHGEQFPSDLKQLSEIYGQGSSFLARALAELELVSPGARLTDSSDAVLIRERAADTKGRRMFAYIDGHFEAHTADGRSFSVREPGMR
jgi:hypothetical protein